ncbi:Asp-tRNA(Asn)/Glu-tRNA(Gln) amidotransferase subunit GatA [Candidatus Hecatella orcuttiae]|jgi:aspartyl-tRNA(Asn)/glutamyl-tRNA(Gln) amidotransferase subunit A|uniref:Asp-tRNA(Asn)/Glu-tRNA(Gln) amidotransferase subunit GatA n=1 Tax=Candidatus Hecatella orcuttiae TaxID=1935119 RepID=UPI0028682B67|nr:Asp-tRNA(Asn)/Glu-tRNA(Gln) amidotransferase subunit GatA [Candidatus Hecatella orcuttiae]
MEPYKLGAWEISQKIRNRELTARECIVSFLSRIDSLEPKVKAYVSVLREAVLKKAEKIDKKVKRGERVGMLAGVAVAVKDNICTKGVKTTCASKILENFVPPYDATVVERIEAEDGIVIGKTNMDEFAMGSSTETSYFGPTRNPWDLSRVPGGSSGGSAAAVSAQEAPLALGSDTGGSIRCPASFCGVVGLKPTYGLVSRYGLIAYANSLEQIGPLARGTYDCALLLSVIGGYDERDSTSVNRAPRDYTRSLGKDLRGLKVGVLRELIGLGTDEAVVKAVLECASKLEEMGALCQEISLPVLSYALPAYYLIAMSEASSNLARYDGVRYGYRTEVDLDWNQVFSKSRREGFGAEVKRRIILGTYALSAGYYDRFFLKSLKVATLIKRSFEKAFQQVDVLLAPTMPLLPFRLGEKIDNPLALYMCDVDTVPVNLAGLPAVSFPCGFHQGLPIGAQVIAPPFREDLALQVSFAYEQAAAFKGRTPTL